MSNIFEIFVYHKISYNDIRYLKFKYHGNLVVFLYYFKN